MTLVFLSRYQEARKLPPSPRWSPSQGCPCKDQAPSWVTPWIALSLPEMIHDFLDGKPTDTNHNVIVLGDHAITLSIISRYHSHKSNTYLKRVQ